METSKYTPLKMAQSLYETKSNECQMRVVVIDSKFSSESRS